MNKIITTSNIYEKHVKNEQITLIHEIEFLSLCKNDLEIELLIYKEKFEKYINYKFDELKNLFIIDNLIISNRIAIEDKKEFINFLKYLIFINKYIEKFKIRLNDLNNNIIYTEKIFKKVIKLFNKKLVLYLIESGVSISIFGSVGKFIMCKRNPVLVNKYGEVNQRVNWKKSLQYKQILIEEGKVVKSEENPNGINWYIYHTKPFAFLNWNRNKQAVTNTIYYKFILSKGNKETNNVKLIAKMIEENPKLLNNYYETNKQ